MTLLEGRVKEKVRLKFLYFQRLWPQESGCEFLLDLVTQPSILDVHEATDEMPVVRDQSIAEFEHVHTLASTVIFRCLSAPM